MDGTSTNEIRDLLKEIRDLLIPISDAHIDEYRRREVDRAEARKAAVRLILSTERRQKAWQLADGTRSQRQIAQGSGLDEGGASRLFKQLRDILAVTDDPNPKRTIEVD